MLSIYEFDEEEFLRALKEDYIAEGRETGIAAERANTEKERLRADRQKDELARYIEKYGVLQPEYRKASSERIFRTKIGGCYVEYL